MFGPLVSVSDLKKSLGYGSPPRVIDCRYQLAAPSAGHLAYLESHVKGAIYADLEQDLSGPPLSDAGRHPLPGSEALVALFSRFGIGTATPVIAYDDANGMIAARLWWMLRYMGHAGVAVLDGGWQAWVAAGGEVESGAVSVPLQQFHGAPRRDRLVTVDEISATTQLLDARDGARYRGEFEPIDPRAGHIPGALNHCWQDNLGDDGCFLNEQEIATRLGAALGQPPDAQTTHYCGSGVSACVNVMAQVAAGYPEPRLYCGSFSEWCRDAGRRVIIGSDAGSRP